MNRKVLDFITRNNLITPGSHVVCAVSGGKDSMALLHLMSALQETLSITLSAAHFNHQLRGAESLRDQDFVRQYCASHQIPLATGTEDVAAYAQAHHIGIEEAARILRYRFFDTLPPQVLIATAHTADDNLETILMHILRGSGLHGLTGIPPVRGRYIRPLLSVDRQEIEAYLASQDVPSMEDSTNGENFCLRNRLRHHVIPLLKEENPGVAATVSAMCRNLRADDRYLSALSQEAASRLIQNGLLDISGLRSLPASLGHRVLQLFLEPVPQLSVRHLDAAYALCQAASPSARLSLPGNYTLSRVYDALTLISAEPGSQPDPVPLVPETDLTFGSWLIRCRTGICPAVLPANTLAVIPPKEGSYILRCRLPGDRFTHSGGTKKLSRYLVDQKIPAYLRDQLPILVCGDSVAAILPLAPARNFAGTPGQRCYLLEVTQMEESRYDE